MLKPFFNCFNTLIILTTFIVNVITPTPSYARLLLNTIEELQNTSHHIYHLPKNTIKATSRMTDATTAHAKDTATNLNILLKNTSGQTLSPKETYIRTNHHIKLTLEKDAAFNPNTHSAYLETGWDLTSLAIGSHSLYNNIKDKHHKEAIMDAGGIILDASAVLLPGVPGGVGVAKKASRHIDTQTVNRIKSLTPQSTNDEFLWVAQTIKHPHIKNKIPPNILDHALKTLSNKAQQLRNNPPKQLPPPKPFEQVQNVKWPKNNGFKEQPPKIITLKKGTRIDRYGNPSGSYVSPEGTPFDQRALPQNHINASYQAYEVIKEIPQVKTGTAKPSFNQRGNGTQHQLPLPIDQLIKKGYIKKI